MTAEEAVERVRRLAESDGMISRCDQHGYGPDAAIQSNCDWCAAFGVDQDWREALLRAIDPETALGGQS